jgi:hypothetical protein
MTNKVFVNGKEQFNATVSIATDATVVKPPKDDKPPVRPVEPPKEPAGVKLGTPLGVMKNSVVNRSVTLTAGTTVAYQFSVDPRNAPIGLALELVPQNSAIEEYEAWISETPGGKPISSNAIQTGAKRVGDQVQVQLRRHDITRRGAAPYYPGTTYFVNIKASGRRTPTRWRLTGPFV